MPVFIILLFIVRSIYLDFSIIASGSMQPNLFKDDVIFMDKNAYGWRLPFTKHYLNQQPVERGDIVSFWSPTGDVLSSWIKRVVALPGDTIEIIDQQVFVNDIAIACSDRKETASGYSCQSSTYGNDVKFTVNWSLLYDPDGVNKNNVIDNNFTKYTIPQGHVFVMGDNRNNSYDSRYLGPIKQEHLLGKLITEIPSIGFYLRWFMYLVLSYLIIEAIYSAIKRWTKKSDLVKSL